MGFRELLLLKPHFSCVDIPPSELVVSTVLDTFRTPADHL